jgi:septum formation protein
MPPVASSTLPAVGLRPSARALVLGSTSRYRRELLTRLGLAFEVEAPGVDETPLPAEAPAALARRLAAEKARAVAARHPQAVVIGSDQVADLDGEAIGKPGDHARAVEQLRRLSGRDVVFHTAVAVCCAATGHEGQALVRIEVGFRPLSDAEIDRYLRLDQPYDCAGSARSESLGVVLLRHMRCDDPTALVGLPLIETARLLREAGIDPLAEGP